MVRFSQILTLLWFLATHLEPTALAIPPEELPIFNARDLQGWSGERQYWSVLEGQLLGKTEQPLDHNVFLWSDVPVRDFYLAVWVKLTPDDRNSGIQFRSKNIPPSEAHGYQADIGKGYWGRLYHETGRGKIVWNDAGERALKPGKWSRYEILAIGHSIWMAVNGTISVAIDDPQGELEGRIALQIHSGPPQEVRFKEFRLIQNPPIALAGFEEAELKKMLRKYEPLISSP